MAKRKAVTVNDLFGKPPAPAPTPAATTPARNAARTRAPKSSPVASASVASKSKARPVKARSDDEIQAEYQRYGQPWAVRLPTALIAELKRIARAESVNYNAVTRWALQQFTADYKAGRIDLGKAKRPKGYDL